MGAIVNGLDAARAARLRRDVPDLLRLHEGRGAARRADGAAEHLRLHARLDRARRGRPDAPADRAARGAARDAERSTSIRPADAQRDRARLAASRCARREHPTRARALAPGPAGARTRRAVPDDAIERGAYVLRDRREPHPPELVLIGTGSEVSLCVARPSAAGGRGDRRARRQHALHGSLRRARIGATATVLLPPGVRRGSSSRRRARSAGTAGSASSARAIGMHELRRLRPRRERSTRTSASRRSGRRGRPREP